GRGRQPGRAGRPVPPPVLFGRTAAAVERRARGHVAGRPAAGTAGVRARVLRRPRPVLGPAPGADRADRPGAGARPARGHVDRGPGALRQLLHRELVPLARPQDRHPHGGRAAVPKATLIREHPAVLLTAVLVLLAGCLTGCVVSSAQEVSAP